MRLDWTPHADAPVRLDQDPRWALLGLSGHGAPDTTIRTAGTPDRDEQTPVHAPAEPRVVTLTMQIRGDTLAGYENNRATLADGRVRALRAFPRHGLAWGAGRQRGAHAIESISLEAPDPFWYDPTLSSGALTIAGAGALRFTGMDELGFPTGFGSDLPSAQATITNPGSVRSFPVWHITGPSLNPSLRIGATGHTLTFALTVPAGLSLRVRCGAQPDGSADAPSAHLIDDLGGETSVLGALGPGSRFWALGPGPNTVIVSQASPPTETQMQYQFLPRHVSI